MRRHGRTVAAVASVICAGCATTPAHRDLAAFLKAHEHEVSATELRVGAGDTIAIDAPRIHEIKKEPVRIAPDGKISLRLVGAVKLAGLTTREAAAKLAELFSLYYRKPEIYVRILNQPTQVFYVVGQVRQPGMFAYTGRDTLVHALIRAQPNNIAMRKRVKVIRPSPLDEQRHEIEIDVDKMIRAGDTRLNILLEPGDVVFVPPTPLGWLGLKVRELLFPVEPVFDAYSTPLDFRLTQRDYESDDLTGSRRRR